MKNILFISAIILSSVTGAYAGNYEETMEKNISMLYQAHNRDELVEIANTFDRIARKESGKWLPFYYAAYANVSVLFFSHDLSADEKSTYLDQAQEELNAAFKLNDAESENHVLQALIYQMRITGQADARQYSSLADESLAKAELLNPQNPRSYYLKALNLYYRPKEFGGGVEVAKPLFEKAAALFEKSKEQDKLLPGWGEDHNQMMLEKCR